MRQDKGKGGLIIILVLAIGIWLFLSLFIFHAAAAMEENYGRLSLSEAASAGLTQMGKAPFAVFPIPKSAKGAWGIFTLLFAIFGFLGYLTFANKRHFDGRNVLGSEHFLTPSELKAYNKKNNEPFGKVATNGPGNSIISKEIYLSMDNKAAGYNNNQLVIGGSGTGKSYRLVGPNIMQANASYVVTDPSGGLYKRYGQFLQNRGYKVRCLNLNRMDQSHKYNPFEYIRSDKEIQILVDTLIANTTPQDAKGGDPFWEKSEHLLLVSIIAYLFHYQEKKHQNFGKVMEMILKAGASESDSTYESELDKIFNRLKERDPNSFALKQYQMFKSGSAKTMQSIIISCSARLEKFNLDEVADLTRCDEMDLNNIGNEKTALFVIIPAGEETFNFIGSMLYSQIFQRLYDYCEYELPYATTIFDASGTAVKTFMAKNADEQKAMYEKADRIIKNIAQADIVINKETGWYEIRDKETGEMIAFRGNEADAKAYRAKIAAGHLKTDQIESLPIQTRMILDEFANIGKIPDFDKKLATMRKYNISSMIVLQSLSQLKNLYPKNWSEIASNCDISIYLGGGADEETAKWLSGQTGKETRVVQNESYSGHNHSGTTSYNKQGVELISVSELRRLKNEECVVVIRSQHPYKGPKYDPPKHPNFAEAAKTANMFAYSEARAKVLATPERDEASEEKAKTTAEDESAAASEAATAVELTPAEQVIDKTEAQMERIKNENRQREKRAQEYAKNEDETGAAIISDAKPIQTNEDLRESLGVEDDESLKAALDELEKRNKWLDMPEIDYSTMAAVRLP